MTAKIGMMASKYSLPECDKTSMDGANPSANPVACARKLVALGAVSVPAISKAISAKNATARTILKCLILRLAHNKFQLVVIMDPSFWLWFAGRMDGDGCVAVYK